MLNCLRLALAGLLLTLAATRASADERFLGEQTRVPVTTVGCNATAYSQIPGHPDLFLGRQLITTPGKSGCDGSRWQIVLYRMDWSTHAFSIVRPIITPQRIDQGRSELHSAYDPSVALYRGQHWVAFECTGDAIPTVSTCLAPFDPTRGAVDGSKVHVVVYGNRNGPTLHSASVPKLAVYRDRLYLFWSAVRMEDGVWRSVNTRGLELELGQRPPARLWPKGLGRAARSHDPNQSVEVWSGADMFSAQEIDGVLYATSGLTRGGCLSAESRISGCYRLALARTTTPLGPNAFGRQLLAPDRLPTNTQEYTRFVTDPKSGLSLLGQFMPPKVGMKDNRLLPSGLQLIPLRPELPQWQSAPPPPAPVRR